MKQILENLEIAEDTKKALVESFDIAVKAEATKIAESKEAGYEEYIQEQILEMKTNLESTLDSYLDRVVENFVESNTFAMDESIKSAQQDAVLEGFNSLMIATGVEIAQIAEAKEESDSINEDSQKESNARTAELADSLMEEVMDLKDKNDELLKTGLVKESMEDMTVLQKTKFLELAKVVEFDGKNPLSFIDKMDTLVEAVKEVGFTKDTPIVERVKTPIVESTYTSPARHLY